MTICCGLMEWWAFPLTPALSPSEGTLLENQDDDQ